MDSFASPKVRQVTLPAALAAISVLALVIVVPHRIRESGYLNAVSGAWAALADDAAHGVLYRPLSSTLGYGGTRYFPLHIVVHALLAVLGLSLRVAGHTVSVASAGLLVVSGALGLSRRGAPGSLAWAGGVLALASRTAFLGVAGIRGDMLPLALGALGLALTPRDDRDGATPAALCLGLAMLAKPTLIWAPAGAFLALAAAGHVRKAAQVSALSVAITGAGLLCALWWSHGQMLVSFRAVAGGGGFSVSGLRERLRYVRPGDLAWILGGIGLTATRGRQALREPFCAAGLVCFPVTLALYSGAGMHVNHLVDPTAIGALAVVAALADPRVRPLPARIVLVGGTLLGLTEAVFLDQLMVVKRGEFERTAAAIPTGSGPILSEQPWVPLIAGERPFMIDAFSLQQMRRASPALNRDLLDRLDRCEFRAVVLLGTVEGAENWYDESSFGAGFREHLLTGYSPLGIVGAHAVYLPRCGTGEPHAPPVSEPAETESELSRGGRPSRLQALLHWIHGGAGQ